MTGLHFNILIATESKGNPVLELGASTPCTPTPASDAYADRVNCYISVTHTHTSTHTLNNKEGRKCFIYVVWRRTYGKGPLR